MTKESKPALRISGVSKRFGTVEALNELSFEVKAGGFFVLFGPSSVGKTTTLRTISGLEVVDAGTIEIDGEDMTNAPIRERGVSMVFQSFALYPHLTVAQNFAYPLTEEGISRAEINDRIGEAAEMLRLTHRLKNKPSTLSGGEQQRVALGRALIRRPKLLLLDEPLTNLDAKLRHDMRAELKRLHRQFGMTIVYATPDELEALSMGESIAVMENGHVVQQGSSDALYEQPDNIYVASKIGSPHMNLLEIAAVAKGRTVESPIGKINLSKRPKVPDEPMIMGIRPSDIKLAKQAKPNIVLPVKLVEPLGDLTVVSLAAEGPTIRILLPEAEAAGVNPGDKLPIMVAPEDVYLFRKSDGIAIARTA